MSARDRLAGRLAATQPTEQHDPTPTPPAAPRPALNTAPSRISVSLDAVEYEGLQDLCRQLGRDTGRRGIASAEIMRRLLELLGEDEALYVRVRDRIAAHGGNRRRGGAR